jgi:tetratricopeptide (TPR) repeat protein
MVLVWSRLMIVAALACCLWAQSLPTARADAREDEARELFEAGIAASRAGRWYDARDRFERSNRRIAKPSTLLNLAIAQLALDLPQETLASLAALERLAEPSEHAGLLDAARKLRIEARAKLDGHPVQARSAAAPLVGDPRIVAGAEAASVDPRELAAREAFAAGRYRDSVDLFARLYAERPHPNYLHNIGRCYQNLREPERAIASFREFLRKAENLTPETRAQVEDYIREMDALVESRAQESAVVLEADPAAASPPIQAAADKRTHAEPGGATEPTAAASPSETSSPTVPTDSRHAVRSSRRGVVALALLGASAVSLGAGTYYGVQSLEAYDLAKRVCPERTDCDEVALDMRDEAERDAWISNGALGLGAALGVTGALLLLIRPRSARKASTSSRHIQAGFPPGLRGLSLRGTF